MLPERLLKEKIWLIAAIALLIVGWSLPVIMLATSAESREVFSAVFALAWMGIVVAGGFFLYRAARENRWIASTTLILGLATASLLYRVPVNFLMPEFRAEDGCVFFVQQRNLGWGALVTTDAGYYHTLIRLFAGVMACLPTLFVPAFYNLAWLGTYSLAVIYILWQFPDRKWAPVAALTTAFISHTCEVFMTLTNVIWIAGLSLIAFVLFPLPDFKKPTRYGVALILLLFSLSGPFSLILVPFYGLRWVMNRRDFSLVYFVAVGLGAFIQFLAIESQHAVSYSNGPLYASTVYLWLKIAVLRIPWSLAVAYQPEDPYWWIALILTVVLFGYIAREIVRDWKAHIFTGACLSLCAIFVGLDILRVSNTLAFLAIHDGDRYFYIPKVLFVWALIHLVAKARRPAPYYLALFLCAMGALVGFTDKREFVNYHWPHYAALIDQGQSINVPTNPVGWSAAIQGHAPVPPP